MICLSEDNLFVIVLVESLSSLSESSLVIRYISLYAFEASSHFSPNVRVTAWSCKISRISVFLFCFICSERFITFCFLGYWLRSFCDLSNKSSTGNELFIKLFSRLSNLSLKRSSSIVALSSCIPPVISLYPYNERELSIFDRSSSFLSSVSLTDCSS